MCINCSFVTLKPGSTIARRTLQLKRAETRRILQPHPQVVPSTGQRSQRCRDQWRRYRPPTVTATCVTRAMNATRQQGSVGDAESLIGSVVTNVIGGITCVVCTYKTDSYVCGKCN